MNVSVNDDIQLKKSENAWKPGMKREGPAEDPEMQKTQVGPNIYTDIYIKTHERDTEDDRSSVSHSLPQLWQTAMV